jgi:hypothetical protein
MIWRNRPGPGRGILYAPELDQRGPDADTELRGRHEGVLNTLRWWLGDNPIHPLSEKTTRSYPPDERQLVRLADEASREMRRDGKKDVHYLQAVIDTVQWIRGGRREEPV